MSTPSSASIPSLSPRHQLLRRCLASGLLAIAALSAPAATPSAQPPSTALATRSQTAQIARDYGKLPLSFEANQGQTDPRVKFLSRGRGYSLFLTDSAAVVSLARPSGKTSAIRMELRGAQPHPTLAGDDKLPGSANYFLGKDQSKWRTNVPTYGKVRYSSVYPGIDLVYYGNQGRLEYDFVVAPNADPKPIRLHFDGAQSVALAPNGDLVLKTPNGQLAFEKPVVYQTENGQRHPVHARFVQLAKNSIAFSLGSYDRTKELVIDPVLVYSTLLGGAGYFQNYVGEGSGAVGGIGTQIAVDASGNIYLVGVTSVVDFPITPGAFQGDPNGSNYNSGFSSYDSDVYSFVAKLDPTGSKLLYSTYFGGKGQPNQPGDIISSIFVDAAGDAYLAGAANSDDFPVTAGAFQTINNTGGGFPNGFVTKLNPSGTALLYSTYIGGYGGDPIIGDACTQVLANAAGNAYVTGYTTSSDFPVTPGAYQTTYKAGPSAFVAEFNPTGTALVYATFLSGTSGEFASSLALDGVGDAYVAGVTNSIDFPVTAHAFQRINKAEAAHGEATGFVAKLNPSGSSLLYATYLGGSGGGNGGGVGAVGLNFGGADWPSSLAVDSAGDVYVSGVTSSQDFPTSASAIQKTNKTYSNTSGPETNDTVFVSKLNPSLSVMLYSTYLGSSNGESGPFARIVDGGGYETGSLAVDAKENIYLTGSTYGWDFPVTADALQPLNHAAMTSDGGNAPSNAFFAEIGANGKLAYSTYLGGSGKVPGNAVPNGGDYGASLALDPSGNVYIAGTAQSFDFPVTPGAYQTSKTGMTAAFIAKFNMAASSGTATVTGLTSSDNPQSYTGKITFTASVESVSGDGIPTGTITFSGAGPSKVVSLDDTGHASYTVASLPQGSYTVKASYSGDKSHAASSDSLTEVIAGKPASITLLSGDNQTAQIYVPALNPVVVVVKDAKGVPVPGANVEFGTGANDSLSYIDIGWFGTTDWKGEIAMGIEGDATGALSGAIYAEQVTNPVFVTLNVIAQVAAPQIDFPTIFSASNTVTMKDSTAGATIYYTTNGLPPTTASTKYMGPIAVSQTTTFKAIAVLAGSGASKIAFGTYTVPAAPVISLSSGVYSKAQTVTIADATIGAEIYYTTNGDPATQQFGTPYTGPFTVSSTSVVQAAAIYNFVSSPVSEAVLAIGGYTPGYSVGAITTAGGVPGFWGNTGDNGPFSKAWLNTPGYVFVDSKNNLYVVEYWNHDVRKVSAGTITLFAGNGTGGYKGDKGKATAAELLNPSGGVADSEGNVYIADTGNNVIRKVTAATGYITTVAGNGTAGYGGDGKAATLAELNSPSDVAVDSAGNLYIADTNNQVVRKVNFTTQTISTVAGIAGQAGWSGDGGLATAAKLLFPSAVVLDPSGDLYITSGDAVRRVDARTGKISTVAGDCSASSGGCASGYSGDGGPAVKATLNYPHEIALDAAGNLYIADTFNYVIRQVNFKTGVISTAAGNGKGAPASDWTPNGWDSGQFYGGDGGPAILGILNDPTGVAIDASGNLYIGDNENALVREVVPVPVP